MGKLATQEVEGSDVQESSLNQQLSELSIDTAKESSDMMNESWNWWGQGAGDRAPSQEILESAASFCWDAMGQEHVEKELWSEGVARLGHVQDAWLEELSHFCATNKFDDVLTLGANRREDGYSEKGKVLAGPWLDWMTKYKHSYGYTSIITAFESDGYHQGWHRDTPDNNESPDHQVTLMVYLTHVRESNGATQFRRLKSKDEVCVEGPPGTVVGFISSRVEHQGLANRESNPRSLLYVAFDEDD